MAGVAAGTVLACYLAALLLSASGLPHAHGAGLAVTLRQGLGGGAWWPAAVIGVLVIVVVVRPAFRPVTPGAARLRRGRQAAFATAARAGLDTALLALGVVAFWELRRYSAVPRLSGGGLGIDPVLAVAPVLALAGLALLPLRALPAAARLLDRLSARGRHLVGALASWQVSRRPVRQGGPILLVVLAVAHRHAGARPAPELAAVPARPGRVRHRRRRTGEPGRAAPARPGRSLAHSPGVLGAMPVSNFNSGFDVDALNARDAAATVLLRPDLAALPPAALWRRIIPAHAAPGLALPGRPARIAVTAAVSPPRGVRFGALPVSLSVQDGWGIVYSVPAGSLPADGRPHRLVAGLAAPGRATQGMRQARYPLRLLGLSLSYQLPPFPVSSLGSAGGRGRAGSDRGGTWHAGGTRAWRSPRAAPAPSRHRSPGPRGPAACSPVARHGGRARARRSARDRHQAQGQGMAAGAGGADLQRRHRAAHPEGRGCAAARRRAAFAHRRVPGRAAAGHRDPRVLRGRQHPPRPGRPAVRSATPPCRCGWWR